MASGSASGSNFTVTQQTEQATLNWASFNIGSDGVVNFMQPSASSVAINRIFQADPSRIFGALNANGQIYLINQNGILFGETATVNVGSLVATSLDLTPEAVATGIVGAAREDAAAFALFTDADGNVLPSGTVTVEEGALLGAEGGQIFIFAPEVVNRGEISTPDGQTILAAGDKIYLAASQDENLRGLVVEVDGDGIVTNGDEANAGFTPEELLGRISADRGNVTLAGFAVNQLGRVNATTSIRQNGSIRLVAQRGVNIQERTGGITLVPTESGSVTLGASSDTSIRLEVEDESATVDVNVQPASVIDLNARTINVLEGAQIVAPSGNVTLTSRSDPRTPPGEFAAESDDSRIYIADDVTIDVAGAEIDRSVADNIVEVELLGNQLRDSPLQRDGALRGESVFVDIRRSGVRSDGSDWQGTPIADGSGEISTIERPIEERSLNGGSIVLNSQGDVIVSEGATLDISGGQINFSGAEIETSRLLGADGRVYDIADADRDRKYTSIIDSYTVEYERWGVTEVFPGFRSDAGRFEAGYVEGKDAGSITILAPSIVMDGDVRADITRGLYQRLPTTELPEGVVYRPFDEIPAGGQLIFGSAAGFGDPPNYVLGDVLFGPGMALDTLSNADGGLFDPLVDELPDDFITRVRPELFGFQKATNGSVFSNGRIDYPDGIDIDMPVAGRINLVGSQVAFNGDFAANGGSFAINAGPSATTQEGFLIEVGETASVDLRGLWTSDLAGDTTDPIVLNGGTVAIASAEGDLAIAEGSFFDVSGGAYMNSSGLVTPGSGGFIALAATPTLGGESTTVELGAELRGLGALRGAGISIAANSICVSATDCADDGNELAVDPNDLIQRGFADISLTANQVGLEVMPGTQVRAEQRNYLIEGDLTDVSSGTPLEEFASVVVLPDIDRAPVNLALSGRSTEFLGFDFSAFNTTPGLILGLGSRIDADPGATISLTSNNLLAVEGSVVAPAGNVSLTVTNELGIVVPSPATGIWLTDTATIDVSGTSVSIVDDFGLERGSVFDGGSISIVSSREGIAVAAGATLDVSGTTAELDIAGGTAARPEFTRETVGSNGGSLTMLAAEYILGNGNLEAAGGDAPGTAGGSLSITIDGNRAIRGPDPTGGNNEPSLSLDTRRVLLQDSTSIVALPIGEPIPASLVGEAQISAQTIREAGFFDVELAAKSLFSTRFGQNFLASIGDIRLTGGTDLALPGRLVLDAPNVTALGGDVNLSANTLVVSNTDFEAQLTDTATASNNGVLNASANLIDLVGTNRIRGFSEVNLSSSGNLRLTGIQTQAARDLVGSLTTDAVLSLQASQVYPTTLSRYAIVAEGVDGVINFLPAETPVNDALFSASGQLTVQATTINQAGNLLAPYGQINLAAETVEFLEGSTTGTNLRAPLVPFGTLQANTDWTFALAENQTLVYEVLEPFPQQLLNITAENVLLDEGATIDLSAAGDLLAYEFVPGVGGSTDFLSPTESPNLFAILPELDLAYVPIDPAENLRGSVAAGDTVFLDGIGDLAAGNYTLLPARYALLPGSVLISPVEGYTDILPGEVFVGPDNGVIIGGRAGVRGTDVVGNRRQGYSLLPRERAFQEADYTLALASEFFADSNIRTPLDAGSASFNANRTLSLEGELLAGSEAGRGAALDVASEVLRLVTERTGVEGVVEVVAANLEALAAESVLLGGRRTGTVDGELVDIASTSIEVQDGVSFTAPDVILVASDRIDIGEGVALSAPENGINAADILLDGDAAFVRVGADASAGLARSGEQALGGDIRIGDGSTLASVGSIIVDASRDVESDAIFDIDGGLLRLGAASIILGEGGSTGGGLQLGQEALAAINAADLQLVSRDLIDIFGDIDLSVSQSLLLAAAGLSAGDDAASLSITAPSVSLLGTEPVDDPMLASRPASLGITSERIDLLGGRFLLQGFERSSLAASDSVLISENGLLDAAGDLGIDAGAIALAAGSDFTLRAAGAFSTASIADATPSRVGGPGGRVSVVANSVTLDGALRAESGVVSVDSAGDLSVGGNANIDLSGRSRLFDDQLISTPGGSLELFSLAGNISVADGSSFDVSAPGLARAGSIALTAPTATITIGEGVTLSGSGDTAGGRFSVDASSFGDLATALERASEGQFTGALLIRQRGAGDVALGNGTDLTAELIVLEADAGDVIVDGSLITVGDSGRISLAARDDITVNGDVTATGDGSRVTLSSLGGRIETASGSTIDLGVTGELLITLTRDQLRTVLGAEPDGIVLAGDIVGGSDITIEAIETYLFADGSIDASDTVADPGNPLFAEAEALMADAPALTDTLGFTGDERFGIKPGIVIESEGDLTVASEFNLFNWQFGDTPGTLTLRSEGNLNIDESINDGFSSGTDMFLTEERDTWSYRLVAGADLGAANLLGVQHDTEAGNMVIAEGNPQTGRRNTTFTLVRTGNGRIDVAAAGDLVFGNQASVLYTAGVPVLRDDVVKLTRRGDLGNREYPDAGGDISIRTGGDVVGALSDQLFTAWFWRTGRGVNTDRPNATGWTVNYGSFEQNVAALGGGNIDIVAGGDLVDFQASIPSIGVQVGGTSAEESVVEIVAGGNLNVQAGGDILGGTYLSGRGETNIRANGEIRAGSNEIAMILGIGDANVDVTARDDLTVQAIVTPTLIPHGSKQQTPASARSFFSTYSDTSSVSLSSIAGDVATTNVARGSEGYDALASYYADLNLADIGLSDLPLYVAPPTVAATAYGGSINIEGRMTLLPSPAGDLRLFAEQDITLGNREDNIFLVLSDANINALPTIDNPANVLANTGRTATILTAITATDPDFNAPVPVHIDSDQPTRVVARTGSVETISQSIGNRPVLWSAKPARIVAGEDIVNVSLIAQHANPDSVSSMIAGNDLIFTNERSVEGILETSGREIEVAGPGRLVLRAGGQIDLQTSRGISTVGNLTNLALADDGASINITTGLNGEVPQYDAFLETYVVEDENYDDALAAYLFSITGEIYDNKAAALGAFDALETPLRESFAEQVFFGEITDSTLTAALPETQGDYSQGFAAVNALYPGANPDLDAGETNPYAGDLSLFFSRIYTLDGGDVTLIVPGGDINAGLSTPPAAFGLLKSASELGIVAQRTGDVRGYSFGDFAVNESRVFAADGGDITIWSTRGDIDAGRGSRTAISAPPPVINIDPATGQTQVVFPTALAGSGIQALATCDVTEPGTVSLATPFGVINTGDAGIAGGNFVAAGIIVGSRFSFSGTVTGAPVSTPVGPALAAVSAAAASATQTAEATVAESSDDDDDTPLADEALGWLDVFVLGFGDCDPETGENCEG
ncbi:MAG: filamentous hemagglutinin family protein [Pseudomonadota bacterium]